jgi:hypothetical protein
LSGVGLDEGVPMLAPVTLAMSTEDEFSAVFVELDAEFGVCGFSSGFPLFLGFRNVFPPCLSREPRSHVPISLFIWSSVTISPSISRLLEYVDFTDSKIKIIRIYLQIN